MTPQESALVLRQRQEDLVKELTRIQDPQARFAWAVDQARKRVSLPEGLRQDRFRVEGCLVRIWFVPELRDGCCWFQTDSDAVTLRAFSGLLCDLASGLPPEALTGWNPDFLERLGLMRQMADNRRATIGRIVGKISAFAETSHCGNRDAFG